MNRLSRLIVLAAAPLLLAALWMDEQPSIRPYEAPLPAPPAGSVPVSGRESVTQQSELRNPVAATADSAARGKALFEINCALCHGTTSRETGPVGKKLIPPPPGLDQEKIRGLNDSEIFKAVTFGFGRMPPFKGKLTPRERWDLVNHLRARK
jgi:mono/diheme cytochrome c family protein